ncbi:hypothetical protein HYH02_014978 [Chlamydomonas schloesseri]|uniref:OBG-type G domain-containing protein n=1 Tax=Chlamydomonas schloesseri TaxID=2026947 RepID=A0A835SEQ1_9CHLO|nr:hypothetical protein HYH02_014978 [Chlamydomonas schloesseri]|eukprot:KAG2425604.1 hypothetical protein HYH02_014978 [Chlamydomonas schloesseri]
MLEPAPFTTAADASKRIQISTASPGISSTTSTGGDAADDASSSSLGDPLLRRQARRAEVRAGKGPLPQRGQQVESVRFRAAGGHGGAGVAAYEPVGRGRNLAALGGTGGPGGDVRVRASRDAPGLHSVMTSVRGGRGGPGGAGGQSGGRGLDRVVEVPLGTTVRLGPDLRAQQEQEQRNREAGREEGAAGGVWAEGGEVVWEDVPEDDESEEGEGEVGGEHGTGGGGEWSGSDEDEGVAYGTPGGLRGDWQLEGSEGQVVELTTHGQEVLVARGGAGGRGNKSFPALPGRPAPDTAEPGQPGEQRWVVLEARLLADVGFVGLPNAGKSTLLGAITAARAKVGAYAFTTVRPQLGTITFEDGSRLVTADIPGLVKGAHANKGRGNAFLRHIERCRCLAYVIDLSGGTGSKRGEGGGSSSGGGRRKTPPRERDQGQAEQKAAASLGAEGLTPAEQLAVLQDELGRYSPQLLAAPALVVANKLDAVADPAAALAALAAATPLPIVPVSAAARVGLRRLTEALRAVVVQQEQRKEATQ